MSGSQGTQQIIPYPTQIAVQRIQAELTSVDLGGLVFVQGRGDDCCQYGTPKRIRPTSLKFLVAQIAKEWGDGEARKIAQRMLDAVREPANADPADKPSENPQG